MLVLPELGHGNMAEIIITILIVTFLYLSINHEMAGMQNHKTMSQNN